ncbi:uncharacterized protein LOC131889414 [Tigriopus californicus]|uniref:uncharacterized protein LOC131889414 n=1 Tax=Tigriopus californicus TaxID=6832 RepID=UPI0027DA8A41|nr:uncharacterized protein LOC131889414 [Tigriopus californicus]|eukprot:TCALIF_07157-PA protein Name:"Protein of unknown function" AED:0.00 eAED:0.00 QI:39/1/1/1/0/0.5/2/55/168
MCLRCPCPCGRPNRPYRPWTLLLVVILFGMVNLSQAQSGNNLAGVLGLPGTRFPPRQQFGCECSDFKWNSPTGSIVGNCITRDSADRRLFCYLNQPNNCPDATPSRQFCNMAVTKIGCAGGGATPFFSRQGQSAGRLMQMVDEEDDDGIGGRSLNLEDSSNALPTDVY